MRRLLAAVALAAVSYFAPGIAQAGCNLNTGNGVYNCVTREEAFNAAAGAPMPSQNYIDNQCPGPWPTSASPTTPLHFAAQKLYEQRIACASGGTKAGGYQATYTTECPAGKTWHDASNTCKADCVAGQTSTGTARAGTSLPTCSFPDQCTVTWSPNGPPYVIIGSDGVPVTWQKWNGVTSAGAHCELAPDDDDDGTPNEEDDFPDDPNENTDTDGDGVGDNNDAMPNDPTNGEDTGVGDESDNASSGGGTCSSPPVSTGDAIAAQIAYQTWATRCAAEKTNAIITGNGSSGGTYIGGGGGGTDMTETNEKLDGIKEGIDGLTNLDGADLNAGNGNGAGEPGPGDVMGEETYQADGFDMSGFGWGTTCPAVPSFTFKGRTFSLDPDGKFCDFMLLGGWFVIVTAGLICLNVLRSA